MTPRLEIIPCTIQDAKIFVARHHRHHKPPQGGLFAMAVAIAPDDQEPRGVAIVGRPVCCNLQDGFTAEVTRLCTDGTPNACSKLYSACWRAARALGYLRLITYTLPEEGGSSLRSSGFRLVNQHAGGNPWNHASRPRIDAAPNQVKFRWEIGEPAEAKEGE